MNTFSMRHVFLVFSIVVYPSFFLSCNKKLEIKTQRVISIEMNEIDKRILHLFDIGTLKPMRAYNDRSNVLIRFIEVSQLGVVEILVDNSENDTCKVIRRQIFVADNHVESSNRTISLMETTLLKLQLKNISCLKANIALCASPPAIDSGNYLIEVYSKEGYMAYYRGGFSSDNPGDLNDLRNLMFQISRPTSARSDR